MKPSTTILTKTKITKNTTYDILMKYVIRKTENRRNILRSTNYTSDIIDLFSRIRLAINYYLVKKKKKSNVLA